MTVFTTLTSSIYHPQVRIESAILSMSVNGPAPASQPTMASVKLKMPPKEIMAPPDENTGLSEWGSRAQEQVTVELAVTQLEEGGVGGCLVDTGGGGTRTLSLKEAEEGRMAVQRWEEAEAKVRCSA